MTFATWLPVTALQHASCEPSSVPTLCSPHSAQRTLTWAGKVRGAPSVCCPSVRSVVMQAPVTSLTTRSNSQQNTAASPTKRRPPASRLPTSHHPLPLSRSFNTTTHTRSSPYQIAFRAVQLPCTRSSGSLPPHALHHILTVTLPLAALQDSSQHVLQPFHHPRLHGRPGGSLACPQQYVHLLLIT